MKDNPAQHFLEEIIAHPDDDSPRLIFADWLDEQCDSARAELIRVQVERARLPEWDAAQISLRLRERQLIDEHGEKWKKELPSIDGIGWLEFRRGFIATATLSSFAALAQNARACWAAAPIEALTVRWPREEESVETIMPLAGLQELSIEGRAVDLDEVSQLANSPLLSTLRTLNVRECSLGVDGFRRLLESPHLNSLTALRVPFNSLGNEGIRTLANAASLTSLTELDLCERDSYAQYAEDPAIGPAGMKRLAAWPGLARVRSLYLSGNHVGKTGLRALLRSQRVSNLKELVIRSNGLTGKAMEEFGAAHADLKLGVLDLGDNVIEGVGASELALAPCLHDLKVLVLDRCEIPVSGARWLVNSPLLASLRRLNVNNNSFAPEGLYRLLEKKPPWLHTLHILDNDLGDEGAAHVAESAASNILVELNLSQNGLGDQAARSLIKTKHLQNLRVLRLTSNRISTSAVAALADSPVGKRLAVLDLSPQ